MEVCGHISYAATTFSIRERTPDLNMTLGWPLNQSKCCVEMGKSFVLTRNWTQIV
jgi:hypothetical protein